MKRYRITGSLSAVVMSFALASCSTTPLMTSVDRNQSYDMPETVTIKMQRLPPVVVAALCGYNRSDDVYDCTFIDGDDAIVYHTGQHGAEHGCQHVVWGDRHNEDVRSGTSGTLVQTAAD